MAVTVAVPVFSQLTQSEARALAQSPGARSASIFMPMHRSAPEVRQNAVRLKNLLREAAARAGRNGASRGLAGELTRLSEFVEDLAREPQDGLALFVREGFVRVYKVPVAFNEHAAVGSRFHVTPLLEYVQGNGRFYLLAVSQKDVRLFEGDKHSLAEVDLEGLPKNLVDALNIDEYVQSTQFHSVAPGGRQAGPGGQKALAHGGGMFHGHAGGDQGDRKIDLVQFFRRLDDALAAYLREESAPLVFAGVDYLFPIYQQVNHYRGLVDQAIIGNPEGWGPHQMHGPAWNLVKARFDADRDAAVSQYGTLAAHDQASDDLVQVIEAVRRGRVGTLLLARGAREMGSIHPETGELVTSDAGLAEPDDLLDFVAAQTLATSGTVFLLDRPKMPTASPIAALYRY